MQGFLFCIQHLRISGALYRDRHYTVQLSDVISSFGSQQQTESGSRSSASDGEAESTQHTVWLRFRVLTFGSKGSIIYKSVPQTHGFIYPRHPHSIEPHVDHPTPWALDPSSKP